jgi:branched-chain amino acid transport system ATP-binding protein
VSMLRAEGIKKNFSKFAALGGISLEVRKGEIRSIIGPNGAGKTTFFNVITGKFKPSQGKIYFDEKDITGRPPYEIAKYGIARTFQIINIFLNLTVLENIMVPVLNKYGKNANFFSAQQNQDSIMEDALQVIKEIGLEKDAHSVAGDLSHGDKKKLDIAIALARNPKMLLLDEPTAGLNPQDNQAILGLIKTIQEKEKLTIVLIEHDMHAVFSISDNITVFQQGRIIAEGKPKDIRENKSVIEAYLGEEF